jgi:hypothetical protein
VFDELKKKRIIDHTIPRSVFKLLRNIARVLEIYQSFPKAKPSFGCKELNNLTQYGDIKRTSEEKRDGDSIPSYLRTLPLPLFGWRGRGPHARQPPGRIRPHAGPATCWVERNYYLRAELATSIKAP